MARYYSGAVTVPASGAAVPVCNVGVIGCILNDPTSAGTQIWVGGPDVTPGHGLPVQSAGSTTIPGMAVQRSAPVVPAEPDDPPATLYACTDAGKNATVYWLSSLPPIT